MEFIRIPLRGKYGEGKFTLVDGDYDGEYFRQFKWYVNKFGYAYRKLDGKPSYLHKEVCWVPKGLWADHINRDKLDNRSCNLRAVTPSENSRNSDRYDNRMTVEEKKARRKEYIRTHPEIYGDTPARKRWRETHKKQKSEYDKLRYQRLKSNKENKKTAQQGGKLSG